MNRAVKSLIIGAGPAGIAAARHALANKHTPMVVLQKNKDFGGLWNPQFGYAWDGLNTNTYKYACKFLDFSYPENTPIFPSAKQFYQYMGAYTEHHKISEHIQFCAEAQEVIKLENGLYQVTFSQTIKNQNAQPEIKKQTILTEALIIASGIYNSPYIPQIPGLQKFKGKVIHSSLYKNPSQFENQNVLIVGGGISAAQISGQIASKSKKVYNAFRKKFFCLTKFKQLPSQNPNEKKIFPIDFLFFNRAFLLQKTNIPQEQAIYQINKKIISLFPQQQKVKQLALSDEDLHERLAVTVSDTYVQCAEKKIIEPINGCIKQIIEDKVIFQDGRQKSVDSIILCTGYRNPLKFLSKQIKDILQFNQQNPLMSVFLHNYIWHPYLPNLFFMGQHKGSFVSVLEPQAEYIFAMIGNKFQTPSQQQIIKEIQQTKQKFGDVNKLPHSAYGNYVEYIDKLRKQMKCRRFDVQELKAKKPEIYMKFLQMPYLTDHRHMGIQSMEKMMKEIMQISNTLEVKKHDL